MSSFLISTRLNNLERETGSFLLRSEFNTFLETELGTEQNGNIQTIAQLSNTTGNHNTQITQLFNTTDGLTTLINQETQLDNSIYTNIHCKDGIQLLKDIGLNRRALLAVLSEAAIYFNPDVHVGNLISPEIKKKNRWR
jgi:hypothetical protein